MHPHALVGLHELGHIPPRAQHVPSPVQLPHEQLHFLLNVSLVYVGPSPNLVQQSMACLIFLQQLNQLVGVFFEQFPQD